MTRVPRDAECPPEIRRALAAHSTLTLAYTDKNGGPQACAVFYALTDSRTLAFLSSPSTRHGRALSEQHPTAPVAFTAQADGQTWTTLTGLQGRGYCRRLRGTALESARAAYARRFPFVATDGRLAQALATAEFLEIRPTWLRLIDNGQDFGHKTEWG